MERTGRQLRVKPTQPLTAPNGCCSATSQALPEGRLVEERGHVQLREAGFVGLQPPHALSFPQPFFQTGLHSASVVPLPPPPFTAPHCGQGPPGSLILNKVCSTQKQITLLPAGGVSFLKKLQRVLFRGEEGRHVCGHTAVCSVWSEACAGIRGLFSQRRPGWSPRGGGPASLSLSPFTCGCKHPLEGWEQLSWSCCSSV